jgi:hypothetical protein
MCGWPSLLVNRYSGRSGSPSRRKTSWKRVTGFLLSLDRRDGRERTERRKSGLRIHVVRRALGLETRRSCRVSLVAPQSRPQLAQVVSTVILLQSPQQPFAVSRAKPELRAVKINRKAKAEGKLQVTAAVQPKRKHRHDGERHLNPGNQHRSPSAPLDGWQTWPTNAGAAGARETRHTRGAARCG